MSQGVFHIYIQRLRACCRQQPKRELAPEPLLTASKLAISRFIQLCYQPVVQNSDNSRGNDLPTDETSTLPPREFWCFISYRHLDNQEQGRQWASWIHHSLETYAIPTDLIGQKNDRGDVIPERLYPVFRDEEELPVDADLASPIYRALDASRFLLVICSPRAVESRYVAEEIRYYKSLGREDRVLAAIIEGVPNASRTAQLDESKECFPEPLRHRVGADGELLEEPTEPVAADFRLEGGDQGWCIPEAYRASLQAAGDLSPAEIKQRVESYRARCELMKLKIIAGVLGIPLGTLTKRDQAYQLALERKRSITLRRWLGAVAVLGLCTMVAGIIAVHQAGLAKTQEAEALRQRDIAAEREQEALRSEAEAVRQRGIAQEQEEEAVQQRGIAEAQAAEALRQEGIAREQEQKARANLALATERLSEAHYQDGLRYLWGAQGYQSHAAMQFITALNADPDHAAARRMLQREAANRTWILPETIIDTGSQIAHAWMDGPGDGAVTLSSHGDLSVFDLPTGRRIHYMNLFDGAADNPEIYLAAASSDRSEIALVCRVNRPREIQLEGKRVPVPWSWEMRRYRVNGELAAQSLLPAMNRGEFNDDLTAIRASRMQDGPLFYDGTGHLVLLRYGGYDRWPLTSGGNEPPLERQWSWKPKGDRWSLPQGQSYESIYGWDMKQPGRVHLVTNRHVLEVDLASGRTLRRKPIRTVAQDDEDPFFPTPHDWSGMVSFSDSFGGVAISGFSGGMNHLPVGFAANFSKPWSFTPIKQGMGYSYEGVFAFLPKQGTSIFHGGTIWFDKQMLDINTANSDHGIYLPLDDRPRATEWPPYSIELSGDNLVMISTIRTGAVTPQLIEVVTPLEERFRLQQGVAHISQVLPGKTFWIAPHDGGKLAQIEDQQVIVYRIGVSLPTLPTPARAPVPRPWSVSWFDFENTETKVREIAKVASIDGRWTLQSDNGLLQLPTEVVGLRLVDFVALRDDGMAISVFGKEQMVTNEEWAALEPEFTVVLHLPGDVPPRVFRPVTGASINQSKTRLATADGQSVRIYDLASGELVSSFDPERRSIAMTSPASSVFYSTDDRVLGVGSILEVQDFEMVYRAFDVEKWVEFPGFSAGKGIWGHDLFPDPRAHEMDWRSEGLAANPLPFFKDLDIDEWAARLEGRFVAGARLTPDVPDASGWSMMQLPIEE